MKNWLYRNNNGKVLLDINPWVFVLSALLILGFVTLSFVYLKQLSATVAETQVWIANQVGWFFVLAVNIILGFMLYLLVSPFGQNRLEEVFKISLEADDIIDFSSYKKGMEILSKYSIEI